MQLTDEQRKAIEWAIGMASQHNIHNSPLRALLAAHSAGAQEPVGTAVNDEELGRFWEMHKPASEFPVGTHVYAQPQPMPQTDAARDVLKSALKALKLALPHMQCDERGNGPDCTPVIQAMMDCGHALAEIERLDRAKGE